MASLVVPVMFKGPRGSTVVPTLIDTGAELSLIPKDVAEKIGAPVYGEVSVKGAGKAMVTVGRVTGIEIPGSRICRVGPTVVWIFGRGAIFPGTGIKAILGYDFMRRSRMEIAAFTRTRVLRCKGRK